MAALPSDDPVRTRINLLSSADVAYWCQVFRVEVAQLRHAVQQVGPQVQAVHRYLETARPAHPARSA